jgi:CheY-like chemotaxis protein
MFHNFEAREIKVPRIYFMKSIRDSVVFIVDDNPFWVKIQTQMLHDLGFTKIMSFSNGNDCIDNLNLNPIIIFLDYQMEDLNGIEVLQQIKSYNSKIKVVFCTNNEDLEVAVNALKFGSQEYLLKENATKKELLQILDSIYKS